MGDVAPFSLLPREPGADPEEPFPVSLEQEPDVEIECFFFQHEGRRADRAGIASSVSRVNTDFHDGNLSLLGGASSSEPAASSSPSLVNLTCVSEYL